MSLADEVVALRQAGKIPPQFRTSDIEPHLKDRYARNYINTALSNYANTGDYVKRWSRRRFKRVSEGLYEIYP